IKVSLGTIHSKSVAENLKLRSAKSARGDGGNSRSRGQQSVSDGQRDDGELGGSREHSSLLLSDNVMVEQTSMEGDTSGDDWGSDVSIRRVPSASKVSFRQT
ncbi:hypothetical protein HYDPIDRAFT_107677, partial [Hydnomerulius pinastri MD-312]